MQHSKLQFGMGTVVMLVVLRLSIGCHFLYEGVWKVRHRDEFSAEPFLTQAKGPAAELFYALVPDIDGRRTLRLETRGDGQVHVTAPDVRNAWNGLHAQCVARYQLTAEQIARSDELLERYQKSLKEYLNSHGEEIVGYFLSLERLEADKSSKNHGAAHQRQRLWDRQQTLRSEVKVWLGEIEGMGEDFRVALCDLRDEDQSARNVPSYPLTGMDLMDIGVTYGLAAIGLCLMLGLFTRLACLAGGLFLASVLLSQPPWPTIYPPAPTAMGHALLVDKNFVEMVALGLMATTVVGRWGGLDFFVHRFVGILRANDRVVQPHGRKEGDNHESD